MHSEPWQVFAENGEAVIGESYSGEEFPVDSVMGAAHVWVWRNTQDGKEVMLQKRAASLFSWPGYFDISAAGHIDANESPLQCAVRESVEEIGLVVDESLLHFIFASRTALAKKEIDFVYLYEVNESFEPQFDDGEVELVEWVAIADFIARVKLPEKNNLVNQGEHYFGLLVDQLNRL